MGVPYLTSNLRPYAIDTPLDHGCVVIDGPSLAYHVYFLCARQFHTGSGPWNHPLYSDVAAAALAWLDELQNAGVTVSAIYFDGALPLAKRPVRLGRLMKNFRDLNDYYLLNQTQGTRRQHPAVATKTPPNASVELFPTATSVPIPHRKIMHPPFFVAAILEALHLSNRYGDVTHIVPGEADGYCAHHVRLNGGTVISSDSDLLVHQLGDNGSVVMLRDIVRTSAHHQLSALRYSAADIARRLSLPGDCGFLGLAFEMAMDPHSTFPVLLERARKGTSPSKYPGMYNEFATQYREPPSNHPIADNGCVFTPACSFLDPRVSELVTQLKCLDVGARGSRNGESGESGEDASIMMFLPFLLDCPSRTTGWEMSTPTRQLAYSLLHSCFQVPTHHVFEHRRVQGPTKGKAVELLETSEAVTATTALSQLLADIRSGNSNRPELQWIILSVYQDSHLSVQRDRVPISHTLMRRLESSSDPVDCFSWDAVHLTAQVHGALYSLRILKQILGYMKCHLARDFPTSASALLDLLLPLPSIPSWPSTTDILDLLTEASTGSLVVFLRNMPSLKQDVTVKRGPPEHGRKSNRRKRPRAADNETRSTKTGAKGLPNANPFAVLNGD